MKKVSFYESTLKKMVEERKGKFDVFLMPQLKITAQMWMMLDKVSEEIASSDLTTIEIGSQGQQKTVINPLLAQYDKMSRTLGIQFTRLGLNYDVMPSKVREATGQEESDDPMAAYFGSMK